MVFAFIISFSFAYFNDISLPYLFFIRKAYITRSCQGTDIIENTLIVMQ